MPAAQPEGTGPPFTESVSGVVVVSAGAERKSRVGPPKVASPTRAAAVLQFEEQISSRPPKVAAMTGS